MSTTILRTYLILMLGQRWFLSICWGLVLPVRLRAGTAHAPPRNLATIQLCGTAWYQPGGVPGFKDPIVISKEVFWVTWDTEGRTRIAQQTRLCDGNTEAVTDCGPRCETRPVSAGFAKKHAFFLARQECH